MAMYEEYLTYTSYIAKYRLIFYCIKSVLLKYMPKSDEFTHKAIRRFAEICDLVVAEKKKGILMAGFRDFY